jgi:hypothetical protein
LEGEIMTGEDRKIFQQVVGQYGGGLDLRSANLLRDRYNQFYVLEKECALGSSRLARQGFQRLNPLGPEDLLKILPLLPMP